MQLKLSTQLTPRDLTGLCLVPSLPFKTQARPTLRHARSKTRKCAFFGCVRVCSQFERATGLVSAITVNWSTPLACGVGHNSQLTDCSCASSGALDATQSTVRVAKNSRTAAGKLKGAAVCQCTLLICVFVCLYPRAVCPLSAHTHVRVQQPPRTSL